MIRVPDGAVHLALFDISIWNIDCRYIDTFQKYRCWYGHFENIYIDIDKSILKNMDIDNKTISHFLDLFSQPGRLGFVRVAGQFESRPLK